VKKLFIGAAFLVASLCLCFVLLRKGGAEPVQSASNGPIAQASVAEPKAPVGGKAGTVFSIELKPSFAD
jgi:hypothetical protein